MAAAVADYRAARQTEGKRPKDGEPWLVELVPTPDVLRALGAARTPSQVLVAFGAESGEEGRARKRRMLDEKDVDLVVFNDIGRSDIGFDAAENEVWLIRRDRQVHVPKAGKDVVARAVLDEVERIVEERG